MELTDIALFNWRRLHHGRNEFKLCPLIYQGRRWLYDCPLLLSLLSLILQQLDQRVRHLTNFPIDVPLQQHQDFLDLNHPLNPTVPLTTTPTQVPPPLLQHFPTPLTNLSQLSYTRLQHLNYHFLVSFV